MFYIMFLVFVVIALLPKLSLRIRFICFGFALSALPISVATDSYRFGLFAHDGFLIAMGLLWFFYALHNRKVSKYEIYFGILVIFLTILAILNYSENVFDKYFIRDLRIFLYVLMVVVFANIISKLTINENDALIIFASSAVFSIIYWLLLNMGLNFSNDSYYIENSYRYIAVSTFISATGLAFFDRFSDSQISIRSRLILEILMLTAVVVSGLRLLLFATIIVYLIRRLRSFSGGIYIIFLLIAGVGLIGIARIIDFAPLIELNQRIDDYSIAQLVDDMDTRLSPEIFNENSNSTAEGLGSFHSLFGAGFGTTFYVPWFDYREGKDVYNNFIDSSYVTLIYKFGVIGLILLILPIFNIFKVSDRTSLRDFFSILIFISLLYIGYCLPYQIDTIGIWVAFAVLFSKVRRIDHSRLNRKTSRQRLTPLAR